MTILTPKSPGQGRHNVPHEYPSGERQVSQNFKHILHLLDKLNEKQELGTCCDPLERPGGIGDGGPMGECQAGPTTMTMEIQEPPSGMTYHIRHKKIKSGGTLKRTPYGPATPLNSGDRITATWEGLDPGDTYRFRLEVWGNGVMHTVYYKDCTTTVDGLDTPSISIVPAGYAENWCVGGDGAGSSNGYEVTVAGNVPEGNMIEIREYYLDQFDGDSGNIDLTEWGGWQHRWWMDSTADNWPVQYKAIVGGVSGAPPSGWESGGTGYKPGTPLVDTNRMLAVRQVERDGPTGHTNVGHPSPKASAFFLLSPVMRPDNVDCTIGTDCPCEKTWYRF